MADEHKHPFSMPDEHAVNTTSTNEQKEPTFNPMAGETYEENKPVYREQVIVPRYENLKRDALVAISRRFNYNLTTRKAILNHILNSRTNVKTGREIIDELSLRDIKSASEQKQWVDTYIKNHHPAPETRGRAKSQR
jgi:hypothetical protein